MSEDTATRPKTRHMAVFRQKQRRSGKSEGSGISGCAASTRHRRAVEPRRADRGGRQGRETVSGWSPRIVMARRSRRHPALRNIRRDRAPGSRRSRAMMVRGGSRAHQPDVVSGAAMGRFLALERGLTRLRFDAARRLSSGRSEVSASVPHDCERSRRRMASPRLARTIRDESRGDRPEAGSADGTVPGSVLAAGRTRAGGAAKKSPRHRSGCRGLGLMGRRAVVRRWRASASA